MIGYGDENDNDINVLIRQQDATIDALSERTRRAEAEIERLRAALKRISELDVPRPVGRAWRQDGAPSRHDACPHDLRMYEDCYACIAEYAGAVLEGKEKGDGA